MRRAALLVLALIASLAIAAPAHAADPILTAQDAAQPATSSGCTPVAFTYAANPPAGYSQVSVFLSVTNSNYDFVGYGSFDGATRSGSLQICNVTNREYVLEMSVSACTSSYSSCQDYDGPDARFFVGPRPVYTPPPVVPPVVAPAPTGLSAKCVSARKSLKKAKASHKVAAIKRAKAKVKRVC